jgi:Leucine-rich repeat (LRR) protein
LKFNDVKNATKIEYETREKESNNETIINKEIRFQALDLDDLENLTEINFHNCELTSLNVDSFKNLRSLKKLTLSFNKLKSLKELNSIVS